jgi:hypothetical protein
MPWKSDMLSAQGWTPSRAVAVAMRLTPGKAPGTYYRWGLTKDTRVVDKRAVSSIFNKKEIPQSWDAFIADRQKYLQEDESDRKRAHTLLPRTPPNLACRSPRRTDTTRREQQYKPCTCNPRHPHATHIPLPRQRKEKSKHASTMAFKHEHNT